MNQPLPDRDPKLPRTTRTANLAHFLTRNARRIPHRPAIVLAEVDGTETVFDWATLDARVSALAAAMRDRFGLTAGRRLLVQSSNNNQITETMLACWRLGAVWTPANYRQGPEEVAYLAQKADVALMMCEGRPRCCGSAPASSAMTMRR
jgi:fatty-acyl-CoA synthase